MPALNITSPYVARYVFIFVSGYRGLEDADTVFFHLDAVKQTYDGFSLMLIHGDCPTGADAFAKEWAKFHEIPYLSWPAKWKTGSLGKREGPKRNEEMSEFVKAISQYGVVECLAFWDPKSKGTVHAIDLMRSYFSDESVKIIGPRGEEIKPHEFSGAMARYSGSPR